MSVVVPVLDYARAMFGYSHYHELADYAAKVGGHKHGLQSRHLPVIELTVHKA